MGSIKVSVYGRIKPCLKNTPRKDYKIKYGDHEDQISFSTKTSAQKVFRFRKLFGEDATQKQIFEVVAKPVIKNVFEGYNGTIFTYGQTGSGKTHTMSGDLEDWVQCGLIPRTLQEVFKIKENSTVITIAYFEIYNEHVYDLIRTDQADSNAGHTHFPDESGTITNFRNLSVHIVKSAFDALQLYRRGDANKMVAETSSNARSSRSHVIFSIGLEFPHPQEELRSLKPVLYLVDLAGSERITKYNKGMSNPWETRYINLSLHYLEQVLVALRQPGRAHIPYRNSLMTALLRNSLGGNCITCMIATFSLSTKDIEETMHTCKFAERIALIKNEVKLSELTSPQKEIESLKKENELLKTQLKLLTKEQDHLNEKDREKCCEIVKNFLRDNDFFALPLTDVRRMEFCFQLMRKEILDKKVSLIQQNESVIQDIEKQELLRRESVQSNVLRIEMNTDRAMKRRKNPLDLPKVNITYKRWDSFIDLQEKENALPKNASSAMSEHRKLEPKAQDTRETSKKGNSDEQSNSVVQCLRSSANIIEESPTRPKSASFGLKFSGESKRENIDFVNVSSLNTGSIKSDFSGLTSPHKNSINLGPRHKKFSIEIPRKSVDKGVQKEYTVDIIKNSEANNLKSKGKFSALCVPLTGDKEVDEEILKFYKTRYDIFKDK